MIFQKLKVWLRERRFKTIIKKCVSSLCLCALFCSILVSPTFAADNDKVNILDIYNYAYFDQWLEQHSDYPFICFATRKNPYHANNKRILCVLSETAFYTDDVGHWMSDGHCEIYKFDDWYSPDSYSLERYSLPDGFASTDEYTNNVFPYWYNNLQFYCNSLDGENIGNIDWGKIQYSLSCTLLDESPGLEPYILCNVQPSFDFSQLVNIGITVNASDGELLVPSSYILNPIEYDGGTTFLLDLHSIMPLNDLVVTSVTVRIQDIDDLIFTGSLTIRKFFFSPSDYVPTSTIIQNIFSPLTPSDTLTNDSFYGISGQIWTDTSSYDFVFNHDSVDVSEMNCVFLPATISADATLTLGEFDGYDIIFYDCDNTTMSRIYGSDWNLTFDDLTNFALRFKTLVINLVVGNPSGSSLYVDDVGVIYTNSYYLKRGLQSLGVINGNVLAIDTAICSFFEPLGNALTNLGTYAHDSASYLFSLSSLDWGGVLGTLNNSLIGIQNSIDNGFASVNSSVSSVIEDSFIFDFFQKSKQVYSGILEPSKDVFLETYYDTSFAISDGDFEFTLPDNNLPVLPEFPLIELGGD